MNETKHLSAENLKLKNAINSSNSEIAKYKNQGDSYLTNLNKCLKAKKDTEDDLTLMTVDDEVQKVEIGALSQKVYIL